MNNTWKVIDTAEGDRLLTQEDTLKLLSVWQALRLALGNGKPLDMYQC